MKSSDIIKDIRSRLGLSQTELAGKLGVSFGNGQPLGERSLRTFADRN